MDDYTEIRNKLEQWDNWKKKAFNEGFATSAHAQKLPIHNSDTTTAELVNDLRKIQDSAQVVLDSGFGTHAGEQDMTYRKRRDLAKNVADRLEQQAQRIAEQREVIDEYAKSARTIALYLKEFCNKELGYAKMIADAARCAEQRIGKLEQKLADAKEGLNAAISDIPHECGVCARNVNEDIKCVHCYGNVEAWNTYEDCFVWRGALMDGKEGL